MVGPVGWLFRRFSRKKISWGLHGERIINNIPTALLAPWRPQCSRTRPPWRPSGCQKCYGGSYWGSIHNLQKKFGVAEVRGSSTGTTITILTPWRPPWWRGLRTCPGKRLRFCWWTAPPCNPLDYYFFESLRMNHQQEPPKHFGLPEGLHGGPIPEHAQGGDYARLVPLPHYNPVCHRSRGWLHLFYLSLSSSIYYYHEIQEKSRRKLYFWVCERETLFVPIYRADPVYIYKY